MNHTRTAIAISLIGSLLFVPLANARRHPTAGITHQNDKRADRNVRPTNKVQVIYNGR